MFTVRVSEAGGPLAFSNPHDVFRAFDAQSALAALDACDASLRDGHWIAGYLSYELGAAFVGLPVRASAWPLLAIGVFGAPEPAPAASGSGRLSALLRRVDWAAYDRAIEDIRRDIYDGDVYQVNYTVPFDCAIEGDPYALWREVAATTGSAYQAYVQDDERALLSWSPELFLGFEGTSVVTRPMKGTAPVECVAELSDEKNRAEHIMIVDLLRNDLHRVCERVEVEALCAIERYPTLATMTSTIRGALRAHTPLREVFAALFPCGSITGAPKRAAAAAIARLEPRTRDVYCGSIGYLSPQRCGWWNVAIRTMQCVNGVARFDAGGGIVSDSRADAEAAEIEVKRSFLRPFADAPELWETFASDADEATIDAHLARLARSAALLDIVYDASELRAALRDVAGDAVLVRVRLRADGGWAISRDVLERPASVAVGVSGERVDSGDPWLRIKSAWRPAHERAAAFAREHGLFDALLVNERGEITEGSRTNVFALIDDRLVTPPVACGLLPGILRARLLAEGRAVERVLTVEELCSASAVFVGNSARGLVSARVIFGSPSTSSG